MSNFLSVLFFMGAGITEQIIGVLILKKKTK
jgi:hypothetical protein